MGKKFRGANSKATEARERKDAEKIANRQKQQKQKEDEYWAETDPKIIAKRKKQEEEKRKKEEARQKFVFLTQHSCYSQLKIFSCTHTVL
jgi:hypothetical protein